MTAPDEYPGQPERTGPETAGQPTPPPPSAEPTEPPPSAEPTGPQQSVGAEGSDGESEQVRSGLANPAAAVRGVGAGALVIESLVLLLAIVPLTKLDTRAPGWAVAAVVTLCVVCVVLAGLLRHRWAWYAGIVVQVLVCLCGGFHPMLLAMGIVFGGVWGYVLSVRHSVLGTF